MKKFFWFVLAVLLIVFLVSFISSSLLLFKTDRSRDYSSANIGVIEVEGVITESLDILEQIREFKENEQLKALIVRLNTPGGAVGASQEIYLELKKLREKTPVIISMANVAASGGLYISIGGGDVIALPGSITGSMGVLMPITNVSRLLERIYVNPITIKSGELKDAGNPTRPLDSEARKYLQDMVDRTFEQFRTHVISERKLSDEAVKQLSDGRVVDGETALKLGLVDRLGTFEDAIDLAKEKGGIEGKAKLAFLSREDRGLIYKLLQGSIHHVLTRLFDQSSSLLYLFDLRHLTEGSRP